MTGLADGNADSVTSGDPTQGAFSAFSSYPSTLDGTTSITLQIEMHNYAEEVSVSIDGTDFSVGKDTD